MAAASASGGMSRRHGAPRRARPPRRPTRAPGRRACACWATTTLGVSASPRRRRATIVYTAQHSDPGQGQGDPEGVPAEPGFEQEQDHAQRGEAGHGHDERPQRLVQDDDGQADDEQRLDDPQQDRQRRRDHRQPDERQGVRQPRVEQAQSGQDRVDGDAQRQALPAHEHRQAHEARGQLDGQQDERRERVQRRLRDDRAQAPRRGGARSGRRTGSEGASDDSGSASGSRPTVLRRPWTRPWVSVDGPARAPSGMSPPGTRSRARAPSRWAAAGSSR